MKKTPQTITIAAPREIQVTCGDVFASIDDLVVVAIGETTLDWANPPSKDKMPDADHVAVRNANTGRLSVMTTRKLQREHSRRSENSAAVSLRELAEVLGLKVTPRKTEAAR